MPLINQIHIDRALTNISQAVVNEDLVATEIWPIVKVKKDSDRYFEYDKSNLRAENDVWAPRTKAKETQWNVIEKFYGTQRRALSQLVEDDEKQNQDSPIDVMADTTAIVTEKLMIRRELRLRAILTNLANFDADAQPTLLAADKWDDFTSPDSDPIEDVATARQVMRAKIFKKPNIMVLPAEVFEKVREHPKVTDRVKFSQIGIIDQALLARLFNIDKVVVAGGGENTANEGQADSVGFIWPDNVWIGWVTPRASLRQPSWGYHIESKRMTTERWRDEERQGDMIRVSYKDDPRLITQSAGYVIQDVLI